MSVSSLSARALDSLLGEWRSTGTVYEALADRIRLLVLDGRVAVGTRLPAERDLAGKLQVSRTTVAAAYRRLRELGFADSVRGSGTQTRMPAAGRAQQPEPAGAPLDFTKAALPAPSALAAEARAAAEQLPAYLGDTGYDPVGLTVLREAIARRYEERGLPTDPEQILVTVGAQQAIVLVARTFLTRGDRAIIEAPTYPHAYEALHAAGARLVGVPVTTDSPDGWDMPALESAIRRTSPALAYVMPDFQNPTGRTMSPEQRERLIDAAASRGTLVVADETPAELDIDRPSCPKPLTAYAGGQQASVLLIGSASKTMWGGLRVGWIRAERPVIRQLAIVRAGIDLGTPILEQLLTARLLPRLDEILAERRDALAAGRAAVCNQLAARFPDWHVPRIEGGLAAWVNIGAPVSSQLVLAARAHGLLITAGPRFGIDGAFERYLRVPIMRTPGEVERAVDALALAWPNVIGRRVPEAAALGAVV
ncbi:PLP-dependent aminotransferase family protein [Microbacterium sp. STN6]|uniref:MocR-like transcription factor YczR n=1 Tax=Microbacterium sp. STN6 TaxID=2995588 RepID=UPI002260F010|nr:PLP-dependent aminotransferase family protein [Microbacterium sp. STN6]MCX7522989.1 PLP-dependent aminotransferase family protein [Microbacterium sp. STN6]